MSIKVGGHVCLTKTEYAKLKKGGAKVGATKRKKTVKRKATKKRR